MQRVFDTCPLHIYSRYMRDIQLEWRKNQDGDRENQEGPFIWCDKLAKFNESYILIPSLDPF